MEVSISLRRQRNTINYGDSQSNANFRMQLLESAQFRKFIQAFVTTNSYPVVITNNRAKIAVRTYAENLGVEIISCSQWGELRSLVKTKLFTNLNVKGLMAILTRRILSASNALDKDIPTEAYTTLSEKIKDMEQDFEKERLYRFNQIDLMDEEAYDLEHRALYLHEKASKERSKAILESLKHG